MNVGKATKAESRDGEISKPPRVAAGTEQRLGEAQRLSMGVGQQANLPKWGRQWILELVSCDRGQYSKLNCPTFLME
jgi:hypothetical protein